MSSSTMTFKNIFFDKFYNHIQTSNDAKTAVGAISQNTTPVKNSISMGECGTVVNDFVQNLGFDSSFFAYLNVQPEHVKFY